MLDQKNLQKLIVAVVLVSGLIILAVSFEPGSGMIPLLMAIVSVIVGGRYFWGAVHFLDNVSYARRPLEFIVDVLIMGFLLLAFRQFAIVWLWCGLVGAAYFLAVVRYVLVLTNKEVADRRKKFVRGKIKWDILATVVLFVLAFLAKDSAWGLGVAWFLLIEQIITLIWIVEVKPLYEVVADEV